MVCGRRYTDTMSTYLYKTLIEANASDNTATEASREIDTYKQDVIALGTTCLAAATCLRSYK